MGERGDEGIEGPLGLDGTSGLKVFIFPVFGFL